MEYTPYTSVWGSVNNVTAAPGRRGCVAVTIAGQILCLQRTTDGELEKLGLLQLSKKRNKVFLVFAENLATKTHSILVGWKNPPDLLVRQMQTVTVTDDFGVITGMVTKMLKDYPATGVWKDFDFEE